MRLHIFLLISLTCLLLSCASRPKADLLIFNAVIYTVDDNFTKAEAMVVADGRILATGKKDSLEAIYDIRERMDAGGKAIYPGFIDAHAHFVGYSVGLQTADLTGTESWEEVLARVKDFAAKHPEGWIVGRGWDQNDWPTKEFPDNRELNRLFPGRPVILERIDGHAAIANEKALTDAGVRAGDHIAGGDIVTMNGGERLTGVLIDNAVGLVSSKIPPAGGEAMHVALKQAEANCFAMGLTTIVDCGLGFREAEMLMKMQEKDSLRMRLYVMLSDDPANFEYLKKNGIVKTDRMHIRSIKMYGDGALGSRGACLLKPYSDANHSGFLLSTAAHFDSVARFASQHNIQLCTHAIGDSANRIILSTYEKYLAAGNDRRWRIEHAQVVNERDFATFGRIDVIPSVQPTHATSDMYWAGVRLGEERVKGAYAYRQLMEQNGWLPLGTDFPVEDISPFKTFYAAVIRKDAKGWPEEGYQKENALTREQALRGMTIWAARGNFEEREKGSLEKGKLADFIILDQDLLTATEDTILKTKVLKTFIGGRLVYARK